MSKIPILKPVTTGYRDAWHAIRAMPLLAGITLLIMLGFSLLEYVVPFRTTESAAGGILLSIIVTAVQNFLLTPVMIAVHRYIILNQVTSGYAMAPLQPPFMTFFTWLMVLSAFGFIAAPLFATELPAIASLGVALVTVVVIVVISTRLSILFPAIAVAAPGAKAANAWADSKRNTLRIFVVFLLAVVPVGIGAILVIFPFVLSDGGQSEVLSVPAMVILAVVQMFAMMLCIAIASRLYEALADRLLHPV